MKLFFKRVDPQYLSDAGPSLTKVLEFRRSVVADRKVLFEEFGSLDEFSDKLRRGLSSHIQALAAVSQVSTKKSAEPPPKEATPRVPSSTTPPPRTALVNYLTALSEVLADSNQTTDRPMDAVRLRLIGGFLATASNDRLTLEVHDANLAFLHRNEVEFSPGEVVGLRNSGLSHYADENAPLWHWLYDFRGVSPARQLSFVAAYSKVEEIRLGAIAALTTIGLEPDFGSNTREEYLKSLIGAPNSTSVKLAALTYIGRFGKPSDVQLISAELAENDSATQSAAHEAMARLLSRSSRDSAAAYLLSASFESLPSDLIDAILPESTRLDEHTAESALAHRSPRVRLIALLSLISRGVASSQTLEGALKDSSSRVRVTALLEQERRGRKLSSLQGKELLRQRASRSGLLGGLEAINEVERYERSHLKMLDANDLEAEASDSTVYNQSAILESIERNFDSRGDQLRSALRSSFQELIAPHLPAEGEDASLLEYVRSGLIRDALSILVRQGSRNDLPIVRDVLKEGKVALRKEDVEYLRENCTKADFEFLLSIQSIEKSGGSGGDKSVYGSYAKLLLSLSSSVTVLLDRLTDVSTLQGVLFELSEQQVTKLLPEEWDAL
ncbi:MAG: hypothetical protein JWQ89_33, partial [Devosia sp.]|uniref:HEAT repeat domain-containing protein n=1 Tax=Devosia sp. TaxID=1871048 RepID=UPI002629B583